MRKRFASLIGVGLALALVACTGTAPVTQAPPSPSATESATEASPVAAVASPTPAPAKTEPAAAPSEQSPSGEQVSPLGQPSPTVEGTPAYPTPNPSPACVASQLPVDDKVPPISDADWIKGPAGAKMTIIEYGDFQ